MPKQDPDRINLAEVTDTQIVLAASILRQGGLVAFPTETVYGLGARALDPAALRRIFTAKGRPTNHPLIAHVLGEEDARSLAREWSPLARRLARAFWPGPLTLVVPRAPHVPGELTGGGDSVGVRAPSHPVARALIRALGEPIAAPSANRYQTLSPTTAAHVAASLGDRVELILDGGPCEAGIESTVVDVRGDVAVILRPGALDFPTLAAVVPSLVDFARTVLEGDAVHPSPGMDARHYAPRATLVVARDREAAFAEATRHAAEGRRVGLLLRRRSERSLRDGILVRALGDEAGAYAHELFAALHAFDDEGREVIVAEAVPEEPAWAAVRDRLRRGTAG